MAAAFRVLYDVFGGEAAAVMEQATICNETIEPARVDRENAREAWTRATQRRRWKRQPQHNGHHAFEG